MRWRILAVCTALVVPLLGWSSPSAQAVSLTPVSNIAAVPAYTGACQATPRTTGCQAAALAALNHARATLHLPAYVLPAGFMSFPTATQLMLLSNSDRAVYGLPAIRGLNSSLNTAAQYGVIHDVDPQGLGSVGGVRYRAWSANWAAGWSSALYVYYSWMYDDGYGSGNIACRQANAAGCWGHRKNVLFNFGAGTQVAMGVGAGTSPRYRLPAFTTLYESFPAGSAISYLPAVSGSAPTPPPSLVKPRSSVLARTIQATLGPFWPSLNPRLAHRWW